MTPTRDGYYRHYHGGILHEIIQVEADGYYCAGDDEWHPLAGEPPEFFGPRIPDPERLEAMEEIVASKNLPIGEESGWCLFCGVDEGKQHAPTCPWPRAQEPLPEACTMVNPDAEKHAEEDMLDALRRARP